MRLPHFEPLVRLFFALWLCLLAPRLAPAGPGGVIRLSDENPPPRRHPVQVMGLDDRPKLRDSLEKLAYDSRAHLREQSEIDWAGTVLLVWCDKESEFLQHTGQRPEHISAAANSELQTVWINAAAWGRSEPEENARTLTHEFAHILIGNLPGRPLPRWADEGLAMHLAGQWDITRTMQLSQSRALGNLPDLRSLEKSFPDDEDGLRNAYNVSYEAVRVWAASEGDYSPRVEWLMRSLADPVKGPRLKEATWDPLRRADWNKSMLQSLGTRTGNVVLSLLSGNLFWLLIIVLAAAALFRKWRLRVAEERALQEDEPWARSLTKADIVDIYGDREDDDEPWRRKDDDER